MIQDLSETLKALLQAPSVPPELAAVDVLFDRPTDPFNPGRSAINLFLYDVRENTELRSNVQQVERIGTQTITHPAPLRLNCSYLVTAWPFGGTELALQEHRLLSQALQVFGQYPTVPSQFLQGSMKTQDPPLPMVALHPDALKNLAEFWSSVGNKLRASLTLTVTISVPLYVPAQDFMVTTRNLGMAPSPNGTQDTLLALGGRVFDMTLEGIPGATVDLLDLGLSADADDTGRFLFLRVPEGVHQIRAVAPGFQSSTQPVTVPGRAGDYEITLARLP